MSYLSQLRLDGRRAAVTGAACVDALIEAGAEVIIVHLAETALASARERLAGSPVFFECVNLTNRVVNALAKRLGTADLLVNNAGIGLQTAAKDIS